MKFVLGFIIYPFWLIIYLWEHLRHYHSPEGSKYFDCADAPCWRMKIIWKMQYFALSFIYKIKLLWKKKQ